MAITVPCPVQSPPKCDISTGGSEVGEAVGAGPCVSPGHGRDAHVEAANNIYSSRAGNASVLHTAFFIPPKKKVHRCISHACPGGAMWAWGDARWDEASQHTVAMQQLPHGCKFGRKMQK